MYINTPLKLAVNVYVSTEITARNLQLNTPEGTEFSLFKISEENKQTFYKNQRYHLYQVQYLVFFSNTGTVSLPTFNLTGLKLKDTSRSHDILSLYQQQWLPFNRNSNPLAIKISEKPASFGSEPWLPADNIEIKQIWSNTNTTVNPGDALQRTIIINAQNAPANSLPALIDPTTAAPPNSNYKIYVDKPEITNEINNHKLSSSLIQKITYIPTNTGKLDIPSIKLSWWNNTTSSKIESQIDGKVYNIQPKNSTSPNNSSTVSLANSNEVNLQEPPVAITQNPPVLEATENANNPASLANKAINNDYYLLIIYILISLVLLLLIIIMIISRKIKNLTHLGRAFKHKGNVKNSDFIQHNTNLHSSLIHYIKLLKTNASNNDPNATYKTLCELIQKIYPEYNNISAFKRRLPENSQKALDELLSSLYSSSKNKWNNLGFIQTTIPSIQQQINMELTNRAKALQEVKNATLPELYP